MQIYEEKLLDQKEIKIRHIFLIILVGIRYKKENYYSLERSYVIEVILLKAKLDDFKQLFELSILTARDKLTSN